MDIKFCQKCGAKTYLAIPVDETRERVICSRCSHIHYINPKIVAGCIVYEEKSVLLCKRAIMPRLGLWTLPAGFMEIEETTRQTAERETFEEAGISVKTEEFFLIANSPHVNHVNIFYLASLNSYDYKPTRESSEVRLFDEQQMPWDSIAFHTVRLALKAFFKDQKAGKFSLHEIDF